MKSTFVKLTFLSLTVGTIILFSCSLKQDSSSAANGNELYTQHCATCHGTDLRGGMSKSLLDGVWQFGDGRGYVTRNIRDGIPNLGMPSFEKTLTQDEITSIVDYLYEAAAIGLPDQLRGNIIHASVILATGITGSDELVAELKKTCPEGNWSHSKA